MAVFLSNYLNAPVKDGTGLTAPYKVDLDWGRDTKDVVEAQAALLALLPEKGLKLKSERVPLELVVIDSAEKPQQ